MSSDVIETIAKLTAEQGIWAFMFVLLMLYVLWRNDKRENRLIDALDAIGSKLGEVKQELAGLRAEVRDHTRIMHSG